MLVNSIDEVSITLAASSASARQVDRARLRRRSSANSWKTITAYNTHRLLPSFDTATYIRFLYNSMAAQPAPPSTAATQWACE